MIDQKSYQYKPSVEDYRGSILFALIFLFFMHWISYINSGEITLQPFVIVVSFLLVFIPVLSAFKHRKYLIIINNSTISGFDLNSKNRVKRNVNSIASYGIQKASAKINPKNHLSFVDHVFINLSSGERLIILLKKNKRNELLSVLERLQQENKRQHQNQ